MPDIWSAMGTWAGAAATTAAVIVALYQSKKASDAANRAEDLSQKRFDEAHQLPALHAYVRAWREVSTPSVASPESPFERLTIATLASTTWRDVNRKNLEHRDKIELLQRSIERYIRRMEPAYRVIDGKAWRDSGLGEAIHNLTNLASSWQAGTSEERKSTNESAQKTVDKLLKRYPEYVDEVNAFVASFQEGQ